MLAMDCLAAATLMVSLAAASRLYGVSMPDNATYMVKLRFVEPKRALVLAALSASAWGRSLTPNVQTQAVQTQLFSHHAGYATRRLW